MNKKQLIKEISLTIKISKYSLKFKEAQKSELFSKFICKFLNKK